MKTPELVAVTAFRSLPDAQIAKGVLDQAGIDSMIRSDDAGGMYPAIGGAELLVRAEDVERATESLAALAVSAAGDDDAASDAERRGQMGTNIDLVRNLYSAFDRGDVGTVLAGFDPQIQWREADSFLYADRNPYVGPQAVAEGVFMRLGADVDGFVVVPERYVDGGDTIVVEGRYRGTMKATGTQVDAQFAHVWQLRDGKAVRFQQYTDTRQWAAAAGI
jgi:uncharacterized protein